MSVLTVSTVITGPPDFRTTRSPGFRTVISEESFGQCQESCGAYATTISNLEPRSAFRKQTD
jgi:hypothetical protein